MDLKREAFSNTQRRRLEAVRERSREATESDTTYPVLERKGYVRRMGGPKPSRLKSNRVIEWEITEAGLAKLQEG